MPLLVSCQSWWRPTIIQRMLVRLYGTAQWTFIRVRLFPTEEIWSSGKLLLESFLTTRKACQAAGRWSLLTIVWSSLRRRLRWPLRTAFPGLWAMKRAQRPWSAVRIAAHVSLKTWLVLVQADNRAVCCCVMRASKCFSSHCCRCVWENNEDWDDVSALSSSTRECRIHLGSLGVEEIRQCTNHLEARSNHSQHWQWWRRGYARSKCTRDRIKKYT